MKDIKDMTTQELEQMLKERKKAEQADLAKKKKEYESKRDYTVNSCVEAAINLNKVIQEFKNQVHQLMDEQATLISEYGMIRSTSKGGFTISNSDNTMQLKRRRDTEPAWDERSTKAVDLIKDFLGDAIKKRDTKMYEILMSFLQRNEKGELEYSRVMDLYSHEDKFDDPRWKEGLRLIKESFSNHLRGYGYEFKIKDKDGKWTNVLLNFSSL
ncbi:Protein of unknown function DUF3164 [Myroides sp. A21]|uniref:DUF3164 family protein n=1 Tax=Myroides sp. A21 TaxID=1583100 RepID=UPI00057D65EA|nr:DUF3164 family protein [Myroides sp. A21]AJA67345.1 Protein of unknown function DUF3164 [Myroides sp. A21]